MKPTRRPDRSALRFGNALGFAAEKHGAQKRKGTKIPYISHPLAVASLVLENGGSEDEAIAALLHDVAEDCGGQAALDEIRERFGMGVAAIVEGCSDTLEDPKPAWRRRKELHLEDLRGAHRSVRLVVAADKLHNARSILKDFRSVGEAVWDRFSASKDEVIWYYRAAALALEARGSNPLVEELGRTVREIEEHRGESGRRPSPRIKATR